MWTGGLPHLSGLPHLPGVPYLHVNRPLVWTATTKGNLSYTLNFKPAQLAERVWCTKVLSSLLNIYLHLFSSQARSFYLLPLRVEQVFILHQKYGSNPIRYVTPHFRDWRSAASLLRHRNRAATIVFVCGQKPYPVWFPWRGKSYLVLYEHSLKVPIDVVDVNYQSYWYTGMRYWKLPRGFTFAQPFWQRFAYCLGDWNRPKRTMRAKQKTKRIVTHHPFFKMGPDYLPYLTFYVIQPTCMCRSGATSNDKKNEPCSLNIFL